MSSRDLHRLRLASPELAQSDGNSSVQVNDASSNRAQSTTSQSITQSPQPLPSAGALPLAPAPAPCLRTRTSMEDDLRGLESRAVLHGIKRPRAELSDSEDSDDEPTPKRDRLLEELCSLQFNDNAGDNLASTAEATEEEATTPVQSYQARLPGDQDLPLRGHRLDDDTSGIEERRQQSDLESAPGDRRTEDSRRTTPPTKP